ncbi:MAG TPA: lysophospholipid acyltransferase family protein [Bryobacteraceae bacterium]|nr:lysophospholipid acyltransferase family protein [Bryobacteraceae bacterium]
MARSPRSSLRDRAEYAAAYLLLSSLRLGSRRFAGMLARGYVAVLDRAVPKLRRTAIANLERAYPEWPPAQRKAVADDVFHSIARLLVAFARFPSIDRSNVSEWIRYEGREHFEEAKRQGRGVLFATAHLGNWELSAFAHGLMAEPMNVVVRPLDNPLIDRLVEHRRTLSGNRIIEKKEAARAILKALDRNEAVGILIDQNSGLDQGVFVDFFGIPACASVGLARLAAHSGALVIPGFALWSEKENKYVLRFHAPIEMSGDAARDTARLQAMLEGVIREHPSQWLWIHRRWKTRPPGEPPLY